MSRVPGWARRFALALWWCSALVWFGLHALRSGGVARVGSIVVLVLIVAQAGLALAEYTRPRTKRRRAREADRTGLGTAED